MAIANNIPVYQPENFRADEDVAALAELKPDVVIADSVQTLYSRENTSSPGSISLNRLTDAPIGDMVAIVSMPIP